MIQHTVICMDETTVVTHVAVECSDQDSADRFFTGVLGIPKVKSSQLSDELSVVIFKRDTGTRFETYDNGTTRFEVFITAGQRKPTYHHIGISVDDKNKFITRCKDQGLEPFVVDKNGKHLLFVRDFSSNLFEVVEK
jgi:catechol 2,3-dioxygenase-like lactoylglutathione lyase family enzyme